MKASKANLKKYVGQKLAAAVTKTWYEDFVDDETGEVVNMERTEVIIDRETVFEKDHINMVADANIKTVLFHKQDDKQVDYSVIFNTLQKDPTNSGKQAIEYIYMQLKSTQAPDEETAKESAKLATKHCNPMWKNKYKVVEIEAMVEKAILAQQ